MTGIRDARRGRSGLTGLSAPVAMTVVAVATACDGGAERADAPAAQVRDSAGVTIVENARADSAAWRWWRVAGEPETQIGTVDGEGPLSLHRVAGVVRLGDGRLAVANAGSSEIRLFDATGSYVGAAGGPGAGPGEFRQLSLILRGAGDSILAWDGNLRRVTVFAPDGTYRRDLQLLSGGSPLALVGVFDDGALLGTQTIFDGATAAGAAGAALQRLPLAAAAFDRTGALLAELGTFPGDERSIHVGDGFVNVAVPPFGRRTQLAANGDHVVVATQDRGELLLHDRTGALARIVRTGVTPRPVTDADIEAHIGRVVADLPAERQADVRAGLERLPRVAQQPAHGPLVIATNGDIWLSDFPDPATQRAAWTVFDRGGEPRARVRLPDSFRLLTVDNDRLLGVARDDLDVEYVRVYRLDR